MAKSLTAELNFFDLFNLAQEKIFHSGIYFLVNGYYKLQRKSMRFYPDFMRLFLLVHILDFSPMKKSASH